MSAGRWTRTNPDDARAEMVERLRADGVLTDPEVERAMRAVPRHEFIETASIDAAYADHAMAVKRAPGGAAISSLSQPTIVAMMLELAELEPGQTVLEIGTATGYNAALIASIVGPEGRVVTIELEDDLARSAQQRLRQHGFGWVEVVAGDGAGGHANGAPYDRIIVTTGAPVLTDAWRDQVRVGGRVVTPIVGPDGLGTLRCLVKHTDRFEEISRSPCGFIPMRSA